MRRVLTLCLLLVVCPACRQPDADDDLAGRPASAGDLPVGLTDERFLAQLRGIWLIGLPGGFDHFSWVRFEGGMGGYARLLEPMGGVDLTPLWRCSATGEWGLAAQPHTVQLRFPAVCSLGDVALTFTGFTVLTGYPSGAV